MKTQLDEITSSNIDMYDGVLMVLQKHLEWFLKETVHYPVFFEFRDFRCVFGSPEDVTSLIAEIKLRLDEFREAS